MFAILLYPAIFLTLFRHRRRILWDNVPSSVPDDIRAPQATEALAALCSSCLWLQAPQAMNLMYLSFKLLKTWHWGHAGVLQSLKTCI
uniref:Uncharacterized protein n=1 Tax=Zea mays TaxID=4577 RepID=C0PMN2_MAIZE|nr:unknown [Zea mays]